MATTGIVDRRVEPAERRHRLLDQRRDRCRLGDVGGHGERPAPRRLDLPRQRRERITVAGGERDRHAGLREGARRGSPDAAARARDDGDPVHT